MLGLELPCVFCSSKQVTGPSLFRHHHVPHALRGPSNQEYPRARLCPRELCQDQERLPNHSRLLALPGAAHVSLSEPSLWPVAVPPREGPSVGSGRLLMQLGRWRLSLAWF